jgi:hypothetical protein
MGPAVRWLRLSRNRQIEAQDADRKRIRIHGLAELQFTALMLLHSVNMLLLVCSAAHAVQRYCITRLLRGCFRVIVRECAIKLPLWGGCMKRLTVQVKDEVHRALKMLSLMEDKPLGTVVVQAIDAYLKQHGAYDFDIVRKPHP